MKNLIIIILIIMLFNMLGGDDNTFDNNPLRNVEMTPFAVPIQGELSKEDRKKVFEMDYGGAHATIRPLYTYKIYARIYSKKYYPYGFDPCPAKYDLALGWDGLEKEDVFNSIKATQSLRWVHWRLKPNCPYSVDEVYLRLANNHVIAANNNILKGLSKLKKKDIVYIEGYLISYDAVKGKRTASGVSSTTREDRKANSCEIIYATRLVSKYGEFK